MKDESFVYKKPNKMTNSKCMQFSTSAHNKVYFEGKKLNNTRVCVGMCIEKTGRFSFDTIYLLSWWWKDKIKKFNYQTKTPVISINKGCVLFANVWVYCSWCWYSLKRVKFKSLVFMVWYINSWWTIHNIKYSIAFVKRPWPISKDGNPIMVAMFVNILVL